MPTVVGEAGVQAIRDFIKPFVINYSDITNNSEVASVWSSKDSFSRLLGKTSLRYQWSISNTILTNASKQNFWTVTEYSGGPTFTLNKTGDNCYTGIRRDTATVFSYLYIVYIYSNYCNVLVSGITTAQGTLATNDLTTSTDCNIYNLTNFNFTSEEISIWFGNLMGGSCVILSKTFNEDYISFGSNDKDIYLVTPLDVNFAYTGIIRLHFVTSSCDSNNTTHIRYWQGDSWFWNRHQKWQISTDDNSYTTLILMNTQDKAICVLSASDYASLATKDSNTLYFVEE